MFLLEIKTLKKNKLYFNWGLNIVGDKAAENGGDESGGFGWP